MKYTPTDVAGVTIIDIEPLRDDGGFFSRGAIVDVAVDVRPESHTYGKHVMVELSADNHRALFLHPYVAHGFQTLTDNTEVLCQVSGLYAQVG